MVRRTVGHAALGEEGLVGAEVDGVGAVGEGLEVRDVPKPNTIEHMATLNTIICKRVSLPSRRTVAVEIFNVKLGSPECGGFFFGVA